MRSAHISGAVARCVLVAGLLLIAAPSMAQEQAAISLPELPAAQQQRYDTLTHELRCLVCQNQTIAESNAPLAQDLRQQVHTRIQAGESDAQIRRYLTDRYGDFVLYKPPFRAKTALLWLGPFALLLIALVSAVRYLRHPRIAATLPKPADPEALRRLLSEDKP